MAGPKPWWPDETDGPTIRGDFLELFDQDFQEQRGGTKRRGDDQDETLMPQGGE